MIKTFSLDRPRVILFNKRIKRHYQCHLSFETKNNNDRKKILPDLFYIQIQNDSGSTINTNSKGNFFLGSDDFEQFPFRTELKLNVKKWEQIKNLRYINTENISIVLSAQSVKGDKQNTVCEWSGTEIKELIKMVFPKFYDSDKITVELLINGSKKESITILDNDHNIDFNFEIETFDPRMRKELFNKCNIFSINSVSPLKPTEINNENFVKSYSLSKKQQRDSSGLQFFTPEKTKENEKLLKIWPFSIPDGFVLITDNKEHFDHPYKASLINKITIDYQNENGFPTVSRPTKKLYIAKYNAPKGYFEFPSENDLKINTSDEDEVVKEFCKFKIYKIDDVRDADILSSYLELHFDCQFMTIFDGVIPRTFEITVYEKTITVSLKNLNSVYLSIDLGTSAICVAVLDRGATDKKISKIKLQEFTNSTQHEDLIEADYLLHPTTVFFEVNGRDIRYQDEIPLEIGTVLRAGNKVLPNIKMLMLKKILLIGREKLKSKKIVSDVFEILLKEILTKVLNYLKGKEVKYIIFSHPNTFNNYYKDIYDNAIRVVKDTLNLSADCNSGTVSESESTLMCYIANHIYTDREFNNSSIVVLDIGAGTTDITFAKVKRDSESNKITASIESSICFVAGGNFYDFLLAEAFSIMLNEIIDEKYSNSTNNKIISPSKFLEDLPIIQEEIKKLTEELSAEQVNGEKLANESLQKHKKLLEDKKELLEKSLRNQKEFKRVIIQLKENMTELMREKTEDNSSTLKNMLENSIKNLLESVGLTDFKMNHFDELMTSLAKIGDTEISSALGELKLSEQVKEATAGQIENILSFVDFDKKKPLTIVVSGRASRFELVQKALKEEYVNNGGAIEEDKTKVVNLYDKSDGVATEKYSVAEGAPFIKLIDDHINIKSTYKLPNLYACFCPIINSLFIDNEEIIIKRLTPGDEYTTPNGQGHLIIFTTFDATKYNDTKNEYTMEDIKSSPYFSGFVEKNIDNSTTVRVKLTDEELNVYINDSREPIVFENNPETLHEKLFNESMWPDSY